MNNVLKHVSKQSLICYKDILNILRYGSGAPRYAERIWVDTQHCNRAIRGLNGRQLSGRVIDSYQHLPNFVITSVREVEKINYCIERWENGKSWEDTGVYEYMEKLITKKGEFDGCRNLNDIIRRYEKLDMLFQQIKIKGRLKTREEIDCNNFREEGGILIHIGKNGEFYFGMGGCHRFAIALVLKLLIPAQIGFVHKDALCLMPELRRAKGWGR